MIGTKASRPVLKAGMNLLGSRLLRSPLLPRNGKIAAGMRWTLYGSPQRMTGIKAAGASPVGSSRAGINRAGTRLSRRLRPQIGSSRTAGGPPGKAIGTSRQAVRNGRRPPARNIPGRSRCVSSRPVVRRPQNRLWTTICGPSARQWRGCRPRRG